MQFPWFHDKHRDILAEPFPVLWRQILTHNVHHYRLLTPDERARIEDDLRIFVAEKFWEGGGGMEVTEEMKVTISALACLLTLGFAEHDYYPNVESIIVYPAGYRIPAHGEIVGGSVIMGGMQDVLGQAWNTLPLIISWSDVLMDSRGERQGHNVALHEFAHKLDFQGGGEADGVPRLHTDEQYDRWAAVMSREYQQLVDDAKHGRHTTLDAYGATNSAEFFAVATDAFFEKPIKLRDTHRELYAVLEEFYGVDWAARTSTD